MLAGGRMGCCNDLCRESESDLHAGDCDGRIAVPCFIYLGARIFRRILPRECEGSTKCGLCLAAACLTRYDGWFLAALLIVAALDRTLANLQARQGRPTRTTRLPGAPRIIRFVLIAAAAPILWLAYNAAIYRNPLEFANGPYSAKSIEQKTATVNPAKGNLLAAGSYF